MCVCVCVSFGPVCFLFRGKHPVHDTQPQTKLLQDFQPLAELVKPLLLFEWMSIKHEPPRSELKAFGYEPSNIFGAGWFSVKPPVWSLEGLSHNPMGLQAGCLRFEPPLFPKTVVCANDSGEPRSARGRQTPAGRAVPAQLGPQDQTRTSPIGA